MSSHGFKRRCLTRACLVDCSILVRCMSPIVMKGVSGSPCFYFKGEYPYVLYKLCRQFFRRLILVYTVCLRLMYGRLDINGLVCLLNCKCGDLEWVYNFCHVLHFSLREFRNITMSLLKLV